MNKTLIELMLEANVEWPEGAEFAAQDGRDKLLFFSARKPTLRALDDVWKMDTSGFDLEYIGELASDWREYITRTEYEAAQDKAERDRIFGYKDEAIDEGETPEQEKDKEMTIEQKIKDMVFHQESIARYQEQIGANQTIVDNLSAEIAADLAALGWGERVAEPELVITDWRDLREGDIIVCIGESWPDELINRLATVKRIDTSDDELGILAYYKNICDWGCEFKFISRPSK